MVRLPRTGRDVIRRLASPPLLLQRGVRLSRTAPALTPAETQHVEHVLGVGRIAVCAACLLAITSEPAGTGTGADAMLGVLVTYLGMSVALLIWALPATPWGLPAPAAVHALDLSAAAALVLLTDGPSSAFFLFSLFSILAGAYRWGLNGALCTALAAVAVLGLHGPIMPNGVRPPTPFGGQDFELHSLLVRSTYLLIAGALIGWLAETELQRRTEVAIVGDVLARVQSEAGFQSALRDISGEVLSLFSAPTLLIAVDDPRANSAYLWVAERADGHTALRVEPLAADRRQQFLFGAPGDAWQAVAPKREGPSSVTAFGRHGEWLGRRAWHAPAGLWENTRARAIAGVELSFPEGWNGRVFVVRDTPLSSADLRFFRELVCRVAPALFSLYLIRRLRSRIGAAERARVARELHDGVVQSLAALRLEMSALRRRMLAGDPVGDELARLEALLAEETIATREMMQRLRRVEVTPEQLAGHLGALVERFERDTGISARYTTDVESTDLTTHACRELARTLQEALVNVRKHGAARHVVVRFTADPLYWKLVVDNDGRPFEFAGRLTLAELEAARRGPLVIKERVRHIGGELVIESGDRGVRLEILVPRRSAPERQKTA